MNLVATPPSAMETALADLLLVRLILPSKKPPAPSAVRKDLGKLLGSEPSSAAFEELRSELAASGELAKGKRGTFSVTTSGRERALRFLGIAGFPPRTNWSSVIAKYLLPKAVGLSAADAAKLDSGDKLAAFILKRKYALPIALGSTVSHALEAVACKELLHPEVKTLNDLLCVVVSQLLQSDQRLTKAQLLQQLPAVGAGLDSPIKADAARRKLVQNWLRGPTDGTDRRPTGGHLAPTAEPFDLLAFAATVLALAAASPQEERFYDNKVFIAPLWRATQREPGFVRLSLPEFKQRLIEANARNLLHLSRADLVQAMDPGLVAESETHHSNSTFHFVLLEESRA